VSPGAREGVAGEFGVYVHIPFCARRCDYCAFVSFTDKSDLADSYVDACVTDICRAREAGLLRPATTVYLGGGTPSLLRPDLIARLLEVIDPPPSAEVTIEANPESTTRPFLVAARHAGATRVSLGVQSLVPRVLAALGRAHRPGSVTRAVDRIADAGFATYSVDVVYGSVGETDSDLAATLDGLMSLEPAPPHVSAYALTVEPGTPLSRDRAATRTTTSRRDATPSSTRNSAPPGCRGTRSRTGPRRATSAGTTSPAGGRVTTSASDARRTATSPGGASPTSPPRSATSLGSAPAATRSRARSGSRPPNASSKRSSSPCAPGTASRIQRSPTRPSSPTSSTGGTAAPSSRCGAGCSPTRSRSGCASRHERTPGRHRCTRCWRMT